MDLQRATWHRPAAISRFAHAHDVIEHGHKAELTFLPRSTARPGRDPHSWIIALDEAVRA
jgi:hypothetical protein